MTGARMLGERGRRLAKAVRKTLRKLVRNVASRSRWTICLGRFRATILHTAN